MDKPITILITAAVIDELSYLVDRLISVSEQRIGGRRFFRGTISGTPVGLLVTGPGVLNTAQATTAVLERMTPGLIIHTGCAGVFDRSGLALGDIGIALSETDIHTGLESDNPVHPAPLPFPLVEGKPGRPGRYVLDPTLANRAVTLLGGAADLRSVRIACGPFITVSTITTTDQRAEDLDAAHAPLMESMEGAAAAHLAHLYNIPFLEIRSASNRVGKRDISAWNLPLAFEHCGRAVHNLITLIGAGENP